MLPAHQRLDGDDPERVELPDRLVHQAQLVVGDRPPQAVLDPQPVAQAALHRAVEDLEAAAAAGLDALQGGVGALDQIGAGMAEILDRDPDRGRQREAVDRRRERLREALGERGGGALVLALGEHGELVAAEARERLGDVEHAVQARGDLDQHVVARLVAERVVDGAEAVQADQQDGDARAQRPRQRLLEPLLEEQPVREPGERVVQRLVGHALLQAA